MTGKDNEMLVDGCFLTWVQVTEHYSRYQKFQIAAGFQGEAVRSCEMRKLSRNPYYAAQDSNFHWIHVFRDHNYILTVE